MGEKVAGASNLEAFEQMVKDAETDLDPELKPYVVVSKEFGRCLKHPLYYDIPLMLPGRANRVVKEKERIIAEAMIEGRWFDAIWAHERPYRCWALIEYVVGRYEDSGEPLQLIGLPSDVRDLAADVWADSENIEQHLSEWEAMFDGWRPGMPLLFGRPNERSAFEELPEMLTVYRGEIDDGGWSWSLDPNIALFFAHRWGANDNVVQGKVNKRNVFGYLTRRSESEVLVVKNSVSEIEKYEG